MRVLTAAEARSFDAEASAAGLTPLLLMENAALGVCDALAERFPEAERVGLLCGPGNNGADGFALARQLVTRGYEVTLLAARFGGRASPEREAQAAILTALGIPWRELEPGFAPAELAALDRAEVLVDALFGVGLTRPLEGDWARLVAALAEPGGPPVLAVDLPSGLDADLAAPIGPVAPAALTVTFAAPKPAHVLDPACDLCGELVVADLGLPFAGGGGPGSLHLLVGEELERALVPRPAAAHKGSFGHLLLVAGSRGKAGAMVLAARAAVVGGAGLTTVAHPAPLADALAAGCPEAMTLPLPAGPEGGLAAAGRDELLAAARERTVVAVGPGLGRDPATAALVRELAQAVPGVLLLDADGLNAFAGRPEELSRRPGPTVLTPHPGELSRLLGTDVPTIEADRLGAVRRAAATARAVVVLKGRNTLVAAPDGEAWVNPTGSPAMASGGSGDVLTGLLAARLAQRDTPEFAACLSVHLHGLAGELAAARSGAPAVPAGDLLAELGNAYRRLATGA